MSTSTARFEYSPSRIPVILKSVYRNNVYYGIDNVELKKLRILLHKHDCQHHLHKLPGHLTTWGHQFRWDRLKQCYRIQADELIEVHLNTLEETKVNHLIFNEY